MQSFLRKIHIYGGLACFWYFIILGVSSLQFNHHFKFMEPQRDSIVWESQSIALNDSLDDLKLAEAIRDSLSLMGWQLPWDMWRDSFSIHFAMEQPAKRYFITYTFDSNAAKIVETRKGFWPVFNSLHGAGLVPNGSFTTLWQWYTRAAVIVGIFSIVTGLYIWMESNEDKKSGLLILFICMAGALIWMIKLYFLG
jgi:hypothetical protein